MIEQLRFKPCCTDWGQCEKDVEIAEYQEKIAELEDYIIFLENYITTDKHMRMFIESLPELPPPIIFKDIERFFSRNKFSSKRLSWTRAQELD